MVPISILGGLLSVGTAFQGENTLSPDFSFAETPCILWEFLSMMLILMLRYGLANCKRYMIKVIYTKAQSKFRDNLSPIYELVKYKLRSRLEYY